MSTGAHRPESDASVRVHGGQEGILCPVCDAPLKIKPRRNRHACKPACRAALWRQRRLPLEPPPEPLPKLNPTAPVERKPALQWKCLAILTRLQQGPASNDELSWIGGFRFGARVAELRAFLRWQHGTGRGWNPIRCDEDKTTGRAVYTLEEPDHV